MFISIFVNPTQFGPEEDFEKYPRDFEKDCRLAEKAGVDYVFHPCPKSMYRHVFSTFVQVKGLDNIMCGRNRPGHFMGVCTVVLKLFNIIKPDIAFFGQKDYQQLMILKKMTQDLNLDVNIVAGETIREKDGLALSSRNKYLDPDQRKNAAVLYKSLKLAENILKNGMGAEKARKEAMGLLKTNKFIKKIDYLDIRDAESLEKIVDAECKSDILIAAAVWVDNTRLIDNIISRSKV